MDSATHRAITDERVSEKARVRELQRLMSVFLKAGKTLRLYNDEHRFFAGFAEELQRRLDEQLQERDSLTFEVTPTAILWEGHSVYDNPEQRENFAFKLYRDGVRLLQFRQGATADEVRDFVGLISREVGSAGSKDLSVLFWEADFKHIQIAIAETFVEYDEAAQAAVSRMEIDFENFERRFGVERGGGGGGGPAGTSEALWTDAEATVGLSALPVHVPAAARGGVSVLRSDKRFAGIALREDTDLPAVPQDVLDDFAMESVYADLHGLEQAYASYEEVGVVLAAVIASEEDEQALVAFLKLLDDAMSPLLATASLGPLNSTLRRIALLTRREREAGSFRASALEGLMKGIVRRDRMSLIVRAINDDWDPSLRGELFTFVSMALPASLPDLLEFVADISVDEPRKVIVDAMLLHSGRDSEYWARALHLPNARVVAGAVHALSRIGEAPSLEHVVAVYERPEPWLRRDALDALKTMESPRIQELMLRALDDAESDVRVTALRYLTVHTAASALSKVRATLSSRDFGSRSLEERRAFHIALGVLGGGDLFPEVQRALEAARARGDHGDETLLQLLTLRSIRTAAARQYLHDFSTTAQGDVRLLALKVLAELKS